MIWVSIQKRKPKTSGYYYWKGKSNYGGRAYYDDVIYTNKLLTPDLLAHELQHLIQQKEAEGRYI